LSEKFDVIVVGAGPAGATAALALAKAGLSVALFERGEQPGTKNVFGGVLYYAESLNKLIPNFWEEAPVERYVTRHIITFLTPRSSYSLDFTDEEFGQRPYNGITLLRAKFDRWYAQKAQEAGAFLIPETRVDDVVWDGDKVVGVQTNRSDGLVYADLVIAADGANSLLAKKAGLRKSFLSSDFSVAAKEVLALPSKTLEERFGLAGDEGLAQSFIGACTQGLEGGAFLYTNKSSLSIGVVAKLSQLKKNKISIAELLDDFKCNPRISQVIKGSILKEYSGHLIPEGGLNKVPELCGNGILIAGDAAGFLNSTGLTLEGMNFAIASGFAAAEAVKMAKERREFSKRGLASYKTLLQGSFVLQDLKTFRHACKLLANPRIYNLYPSLVCGIARGVFKADGQPRRKIWKLLRAEAKGKVSLWRLAKDIIQAGRALIWP
jgi:electron transfer flavoprotein-quinone oxidoreductase